ncbi:MAG TPA: hypothetical protein VM782_02435 [Stellaceae bacterium]|nr:hypothetical protein [Stellaceae bacterium]
MKPKIGTFGEFKDHTLAVARGERSVAPDDPKIWLEAPDAATAGEELGRPGVDRGPQVKRANG